MAGSEATPLCRHEQCRKPVTACATRTPPLNCLPACTGWRHTTGQHRCGPQAPTTYAEPVRHG